MRVLAKDSILRPLFPGKYLYSSAPSMNLPRFSFGSWAGMKSRHNIDSG